MLLLLPRAKASPPRRDWLRPEQVIALNALVTPERFSQEQVFQWKVMLDTGVRVDELIQLRAEPLNAIDRVLTVTGKNGDVRRIPVSVEFCESWQQYVLANQLRPTSWMFPSMGIRYTGPGRQSERVVLERLSHSS